MCFRYSLDMRGSTSAQLGHHPCSNSDSSHPPPACCVTSTAQEAHQALHPRGHTVPSSQREIPAKAWRNPQQDTKKTVEDLAISWFFPSSQTILRVWFTYRDTEGTAPEQYGMYQKTPRNPLSWLCRLRQLTGAGFGRKMGGAGGEAYVPILVSVFS